MPTVHKPFPSLPALEQKVTILCGQTSQSKDSPEYGSLSVDTPSGTVNFLLQDNRFLQADA